MEREKKKGRGKEEMKPKTIILLVVIVAMLINLAGIFYFYTISNQILKERVQEQLLTAANSRADHIETFLEGKKGRAIDFASDGFIISNLKTLKEGGDADQINNDLNNHLLVDKLPLDKDLYEVFVVDEKGGVVGTTNPKEEFGEDFSDDVLFFEGKKGLYIKDAFYDEEFGRNAIAISAPTDSEGEFLGVLIIRLGLETLAEITADRTGLGETGEIYLVNKDSLLITPSRFLRGNAGILTQEVDTENSRECQEDFEEYGGESVILEEHEEEEAIISYIDYRGEEGFGVHAYILETRWCLLAEISESEVLGSARKKLLIVSLFILVITSVFLFLLAYFSGRFLDKKYSIKRGKTRK